MKYLKSFFSKYFPLIAFCSVNSIVLIFITFTWINKSHIIMDDEEYLIKFTTLAKRFIIEGEKKPDPEKFLFINISWEKQLIDVKNDAGQIIGKRPITNRDRLAKFFEYLNRNPEHKFIILDIWFKDSSNYKTDSLLQVQFSKTKNILIPYHKDPNDKPDNPIFNSPVALSDYEKDDFDNNFSKFRLLQGNGLKTTPLVMYESIHKNDSFREGSFWYYMGNKLAMNSFILDLRIWNYDLMEREQGQGKQAANYTKLQLTELLDLKLDIQDSLPSEVKETMDDNFRATMVHEMTKNKIIVIGDFEDSDIHQTLYGATAGPLILLNVFLALEAGDNLINWVFIVFLFIGYFLISYKCFTHTDLIDQYLIGKLLPRTNFRTYMMSFMSYLIYFIILSVISYFLFNIHLTILLLAIYMEILETAMKIVEKRREKIREHNSKNTVTT